MTEPVRPLEALIAEMLKVWRWRAVDWPSPDFTQAADELSALLQAAAPPAPTAEHHRCSVCGLRWDNLPGVELCGDCWRSVPRPFTELAAPPERVSEGKEWRDISTAPTNEEVFFWCVPKTPDEAFINTSGDPIFGVFEPFLHRGKLRSWSSLAKATHWMPLPARPVVEPREEPTT